MFHTCNTCIFPTHVLHVEICNTGVYVTHVLHVECVLHMHVSATYVIHLYFYTCNTCAGHVSTLRTCSGTLHTVINTMIYEEHISGLRLNIPVWISEFSGILWMSQVFVVTSGEWQPIPQLGAGCYECSADHNTV